jgi:hypothetical protein
MAIRTELDQLRIIAASAETDAENLRHTLAQLRTENAALREMIDRARECARCDCPKSTAGFAPWKDCGECVGCQCQAALAARKDTDDDK